jgi:hypothetical protein
MSSVGRHRRVQQWSRFSLALHFMLFVSVGALCTQAPHGRRRGHTSRQSRCRASRRVDTMMAMHYVIENANTPPDLAHVHTSGLILH